MKTVFCSLFYFVVFALLGGRLMAQKRANDIIINLWPSGLPNTNELDKTPFDDTKGNFEPSIYLYLPHPERATGRAVLACPGGAYENVEYRYEGSDWAPFFNDLGIALIVLKYRVPNGNREVSFSDAEKALKMIRDSARIWNINPNDIGIMGSSAGGHLASTIATHASLDLRPNFQILFYPVISMGKKYTHMGSHNNLLGADATFSLEELYSNEKQVTPNTPPAFIAFSDDDKVVSPVNGLKYYEALHENGVPSVLYIFPSGGHGWGYKDSFVHKKQLLGVLENWLHCLVTP